MKKISRNLDLLLLVIYSLAPGIAKVIGNRNLMMINLIIIVYLYLTSDLKIIKKDKLFLLFLLFLIMQTIGAFLFMPVNRRGIFMGIYMFIIPMYGYFLSRDSNRRSESIMKYVQYISLIHLIIGVLLYPLFPFYKSFPTIFNILNKGVMAGRMASVSGSLGFAILMNIALSITIYRIYVLKEKSRSQNILIIFFIIGVFLSLQRSAWLGLILNLMYLVYFELKKGKLRMFMYSLVGALLAMIIILNFEDKLLINRIKTFDMSAVSERSSMWVSSIENLINYPTGIGVGQVGLVSRFAPNNNVHGIPDGDYFRLISEFGIIGGMFLLLFLIVNYSVMIFNKRKNELILVGLILNSFYISMIGSNSTEFYFVNFIFWYFIGILFDKIWIGEKNEHRCSTT